MEALWNKAKEKLVQKINAMSPTKARQLVALAVIVFWLVMIWIGVKAGV